VEKNVPQVELVKSVILSFLDNPDNFDTVSGLARLSRQAEIALISELRAFNPKDASQGMFEVILSDHPQLKGPLIHGQLWQIGQTLE